MKLLSVVSVLLVLLASALAQTPSTNLQKGEPFIPADLGGLYSYVDRQTWPSEGFGIIIGFARNRAGTVLYGAMTNAVVRIDLTQPFGLASSRINHVFDVAFASGVVGIQYAEDVNKVYIIASKPTTNIILLDGTTLAQENLRQAIPGMEGIHSFHLFPNGGVAVIDRLSRVALAPSVGPSVQFEYFNDLKNQNVESTCAAFSDNQIFLGSGNTVYTLTLTGPTTVGTSSPFELNPATAGNTITTIGWIRPFLFPVFGGSAASGTIAEIYRIDTLATAGYVPVALPGGMDIFDYDVDRNGADPGGILYLGSRTNPGRVIQISADPFHYEGHTEPSPQVSTGPVYALMFSPYEQRLFTSMVSPLVEPILTRGNAAWSCLQNCFGNGTCTNRKCDCVSATLNQPWCSRPCPMNPNGIECGGSPFSLSCTVEGVCICNRTWTGNSCQTPQCPNGCSGAGTCETAPDGTPIRCVCDPGRQGDDCGADGSLPCALLKTCANCAQVQGCGWCGSPLSDKGQCIGGTHRGPRPNLLSSLNQARITELQEPCPNWIFGGCPSVGVFIGNSIIALLVVVMFLVNGITLVLEDGTDDTLVSARDQWYRMQRSSKAYAALFQIQLWAATTLLYPDLPTQFLEWGRYWLYVFSGISFLGKVTPVSLGFLDVDPNSPSVKRSYAQFSLFSDNDNSSVSPNLAITLAILLFGSLFLYLIGVVIASAVKGGKRWSSLVVHRVLYIALRSCEFFYFPIVAVGLGAAMQGGTAVNGIVGIVLFVIFALVLPAGATYVTMKTPLSELLVDGGKYRFFAFYGQMKPVHRRFTALPWAKKLLIGLAFAIGSKIHLVMPLAITIVICAVAAFFAFQMKPYADYLQRYLELIVNGCTIAACATLIAFVSDSLKAGGITAVTIIYLIFQIASVVACLGFYLYSWMQLRGIYNFGQCFGGRDEKRI